jgi:hypothetical protein
MSPSKAERSADALKTAFETAGTTLSRRIAITPWNCRARARPSTLETGALLASAAQKRSGDMQTTVPCGVGCSEKSREAKLGRQPGKRTA